MIPITKKENKETNKQSKQKDKCKDLEKQLEEKTDLLLRLQAEFANYRRRTETECNKVYTTAVGDVLAQFVNVFDDFELALKNKSDFENFKQGIEMIFAKFISTGEEFGLKKIKTVGEKFNPHEHEALLTQESEEPEQVILEELQSGYKIKDTVIRTAKVKVSK